MDVCSRHVMRLPGRCLIPSRELALLAESMAAQGGDRKIFSTKSSHGPVLPSPPSATPPRCLRPVLSAPSSACDVKPVTAVLACTRRSLSGLAAATASRHRRRHRRHHRHRRHRLQQSRRRGCASARIACHLLYSIGSRERRCASVRKRFQASPR